MATTEAVIHMTIDPTFTRLLAKQREFQRMLYDGNAPSELDDKAKMEYLRTQALALTAEVHEALDETGWKPWATSNHLNRDAYKGELADVFIFLMNMVLAGDITMMELAATVEAKQLKNIKRQMDGYDGVSTKCPGCKRAYDDDAVKCQPANETERDEVPGATAWCDFGEGSWVNAQGVVVG